MQSFVKHRGLVAPLPRDHIDTDAIIPKQFLKSIRRYGFGDYLFDEWRYLDEGFFGQNCETRPKNPEFVLNHPQYQKASILLAGKNFGCGSSREHAVWALQQYGFRAVIAESFADIFKSNCYKNGVLPIALSENDIKHVFELSKTYILFVDIDLTQKKLTFITQIDEINKVLWEDTFAIHDQDQQKLLQGLDEVGQTLQLKDSIHHFESDYYVRFPWLKTGISS